MLLSFFSLPPPVSSSQKTDNKIPKGMLDPRPREICGGRRGQVVSHSLFQYQ